MRKSVVAQTALSEPLILLLNRLVKLIPWPVRRQAKADIVETLLNGKVRAAEDAFGWARGGVSVGMEELKSGVPHADNIATRKKKSTVEKFPQIKEDIHRLFDAQSQADPHLRTTLRYLNASASAVRSALVENGYPDSELPTERTISNLLNSMGFRLRTVQKAKAQKKTRRQA